MRLKTNIYHKNLISDITQSYKGIHNNTLIKSATENGWSDYSHIIRAELIVRFCKHCGSETYGLWNYLEYNNFISDDDKYKDYGINLNSSNEYITKQAEKEQNLLKTLEVCPICGAYLEPIATFEECHPVEYRIYYNGFSLRTRFNTVNQTLIAYVNHGKLINWEHMYALGSKGTQRKRYNFDLAYLVKLTNNQIAEREEILLNSASDLMLEKRMLVYEEESKKCASDFLKNTEILSVNSMPLNVDCELIKSTPSELQKYIFNLITLESDIYSLKQRIENLYFRRMLNDEKYKSHVYTFIYEQEKELKEKIDYTKKIYEELKISIDLLQKQKVIVVYPQKPTKPQLKKLEECTERKDFPKKPEEPILQKPGLFNKSKVKIANDSILKQYELDCCNYEKAISDYEIKLAEEHQLLMENYEQELKYYRDKCAECEENEKAQIKEKETQISDKKEKLQEVLEQINALTLEQEAFNDNKKESLNNTVEIVCAEYEIKKILDKEIEDAEQLLKKLIEARSSMYNLNIIFGKYRDIVALSTFYEYLMSGRCEKLEGADGAYNLYESECRANMIVSQLSKVIEVLEEIRDIQYTIVSVLKSINSSLGMLNSTMDLALDSIRTIESNSTDANIYLEHISNNSDVIAYNTAATAYYSKLNAELTNSLGYLIALK